MLALVLLLGLVAAGGVLWVRHRLLSQGRLRTQALHEQVAGLLGGAVASGARHRGGPVVRFEHQGVPLSLRCEHRPEALSSALCFVVEGGQEIYQGPRLDLSVADWGDDGEVVAGLVLRGKGGAARLRRALDDDELRQSLAFAMDKKGARLRFDKGGCWYECLGFPDNAELLAALARTAAQALVCAGRGLSQPRLGAVGEAAASVAGGGARDETTKE